MKMTVNNWLDLIALSILWGGAFFFVAIAVQEVAPLTVVLCRVLIAAVVLFVVMKVTRQALPPLLPDFLVMGFLNNVVPFGLLFWAQTTITSGLASILNATTPIFSMLVAHWLLADESMRVSKLVGLVLGLIGVAVLVGTDLIRGVDIATLGMIACLGAAFSYGLASVYGRRFKAMNISNAAGALGQLTGSTLLMIPIVLVIDKPWTQALPGVGAALAIVALAVVSTALAYILFFRILATAGAVNVALVTLLIPVSTIILGTVFLEEILKTQHIVGMLIIAAGLVVIDGRLFGIGNDQ